MISPFITIALIGLLAGFIFSMPIAGPISILITSNALSGRLRFCILAALGASFADFVYVFLGVLGLTETYHLYRPYIPYALILGSFFIIAIGIKIFKTKISLPNQEEKILKQGRNGFISGFLINFLNPTLFLGWLTSSFLTISLVAWLGFNTGGLDQMLRKNVEEISKITPSDSSNVISSDLNFTQKTINKPSNDSKPAYPILISTVYAFFIALGSIIWFYLLSVILAKYRLKIRIATLGYIINFLGLILIALGTWVSIKGILSIV